MSDDAPLDQRDSADRSDVDRPEHPDADHPEQPEAHRPEADRPDDAGRRLEALLAEHRDSPEQEPDASQEGDFDPFAPVPGAVATGEEASGPEADPDALPEAPLFALLRNVQEDVGIESIDRIWIFPPRRQGAGETSVVVVAVFHDSDADRRRVYAAHYTAHTDATEPRLALDEFGTAPNDRVGRLVEEVLERIKDGPAGAPRSYDIGGREDHWHRVLHQLAEAHLEETRRDPRLRR